MKASVECLGCLVNQAIRLSKIHLDGDDAQLSLLKRIMREIGTSEDTGSTLELSCKIHRVLKDALQNPDPYQEEKLYYNSEMLKLENEFFDLVRAADDQLETALKLAAAGNIIDFGPGHDLSRETVLRVLNHTLKRGFDQGVFASLKSDLCKAKKLLYLGDNAGEIVFDKVFISTITTAYPDLQVDFATRGAAILNDVTEEDAYFVGMDNYAQIINNGTDMPGTVLEHCSSSFKQAFNNADVIIAKGQGNFESLYGSGQGNLYYIFLCKCDLIMERCGLLKNELVLLKEKS